MPTKPKTLLLLSLFLLAPFLSSSGDEPKRPQPLFPVTLDHKFKDPKEAFEKSRELILKNYYSPTITEEALYWAATKGMLRHISPPDDPETGKIMSPEYFEKLKQFLEGKQVSLGIKSHFNPREGSLTVTEVIPGSPASGLLLPYDRILRINKEELKGKSLKEINELLGGKPGTKVLLTVVRGIEILDTEIQIEEFEIPSIKLSKLPDKIAVIEIKKITENISKELSTMLTDLQKEGIQKVILDLRNNPGGLFAEALKMIDLFLPPKSIVLRTSTHDKAHQQYITTNDNPFKSKLAILINENTASSCEIFVGALKDHKRAQIVGSKTAGKSLIKQSFTLPNDYRIQFTTGSMYAPLGKSWFVRGITADIQVEQAIKTYNQLAKLAPKNRLQKDAPLLMAYNMMRSAEE